jgi:hypothetical protein
MTLNGSMVLPTLQAMAAVPPTSTLPRKLSTSSEEELDVEGIDEGPQIKTESKETTTTATTSVDSNGLKTTSHESEACDQTQSAGK